MNIFPPALPFIVETLEVVNGNHSDIKSFTEGWDYKIKHEATSLLNGVSSFEFIVPLVGIYRLLHPLEVTTNRLQVQAVDIIKTYDDISNGSKDVKIKGINIDEQFSVILKHAEQLAEKVGTQTSVTRIAKKQRR